MKLLVDRNGRKGLERCLLVLLEVIVFFGGSGLRMGGGLMMEGLRRECVVVCE